MRALPTKGWKYRSCEKLEEACPCEYCGTMHSYDVRLTHEEVKEPLRVGLDCAEKLTEDYVQAKAEMEALKSPEPLKGWRYSKYGNSYFRRAEGLMFHISPTTSGEWRVSIDLTVKDPLFPSAEDAAREVLAALKRIRAERRLEKKSKLILKQGDV